MSTQAKDKAQRLMVEALLMATEDRDAFIENACRDDDRLRERVAQLVALSGDASAHFEDVVERLGLHRESELDIVPPASIGGYRIIRPLGRGGMGAVYLAEHEDMQFQHQVAIKVMPIGFRDSEWRRRFIAERAIVAKLSHPNISRLFDGGMTSDGMPYFVMEFVDGRRIDEHCREAKTTVEETLRLFGEVCAAVDWAHRHLIVHRDLKPANVLVSQAGDVKLVDFGIAKILEPTTPDNALTHSGLTPMTPRYASPEVLQGLPVSTATDVFGLGVLLYELLTERHPFAGGDDPIREAICRGDPPPPSQVASDARRPALAGDLDHIILKALHADPGDRYESVAQLSQDIRNYVDHLPVSARRPTLSYRVKKLYRRRRGLVLSLMMSLVLVAVLITLSIIYTVATIRHAEQMATEQKRVDALRVVAEREAATANRVAGFLTELFKVNVPGRSDKRNVTAREILDAGARKIQEDDALDRGVKGRLLGTMGSAYTSLGLNDEALRLQEASLEIHRSIDPRSAEAANNLISLAMIKVRKAKYAEGNALALEAARLLENEHHDKPTALANAYTWAAWSFYSLGQISQSKKYFLRGLAIREHLPMDTDCSISSVLNGLAVCSWHTGDAPEAIALYERVLETCEPQWGPKHRWFAHTLNNLALAYQRLPNLDAAQRTHERALQIRRDILVADHPDIGESLSNLAAVLVRKGEFAQAQRFARQALDIRERKLAPGHNYIGDVLIHLGNASFGLGRPRKARRYFARALQIFEKKFGTDDLSYAQAVIGLGRIDGAEGKVQSARRLLTVGLTIRQKHLGDTHTLTEEVQGYLNAPNP